MTWNFSYDIIAIPNGSVTLHDEDYNIDEEGNRSPCAASGDEDCASGDGDAGVGVVIDVEEGVVGISDEVCGDCEGVVGGDSEIDLGDDGEIADGERDDDGNEKGNDDDSSAEAGSPVVQTADHNSTRFSRSRSRGRA